MAQGLSQWLPGWLLLPSSFSITVLSPASYPGASSGGVEAGKAQPRRVILLCPCFWLLCLMLPEVLGLAGKGPRAVAAQDMPVAGTHTLVLLHWLGEHVSSSTLVCVASRAMLSSVFHLSPRIQVPSSALGRTQHREHWPQAGGCSHDGRAQVRVPADPRPSCLDVPGFHRAGKRQAGAGPQGWCYQALTCCK